MRLEALQGDAVQGGGSGTPPPLWAAACGGDGGSGGGGSGGGGGGGDFLSSTAGSPPSARAGRGQNSSQPSQELIGAFCRVGGTLLHVVLCVCVSLWISLIYILLSRIIKPRVKPALQ